MRSLVQAWHFCSPCQTITTQVWHRCPKMLDVYMSLGTKGKRERPVSRIFNRKRNRGRSALFEEHPVSISHYLYYGNCYLYTRNILIKYELTFVSSLNHCILKNIISETMLLSQGRHIRESTRPTKRRNHQGRGHRISHNWYLSLLILGQRNGILIEPKIKGIMS